MSQGVVRATSHSIASTHEVKFCGEFVVKRFRSTSKNEPLREWQALQLLQSWAPGLAPLPVRLVDPEGTEPRIVMTRLPGAPLGDRALTSSQTALLLEAVTDIHHAVPAPTVRNLRYSVSHAQVEVPKLRRQALSVVRPSGDSEIGQAFEAACAWLRGPEPLRLMNEEGSVVFGQSDPNIRNFLWDGTRVRVIDYEDSGRSDLATELADLAEHVSFTEESRRILHHLLSGVGLKDADLERFHMARRMKAIYWLFASLRENVRNEAQQYGWQRERSARLLELIKY